MTDGEVIDAMGGTAKVAAICGVTTQAVSQWRKTGISWKARGTIALAARARHRPLPYDFLTERRL